MTSELGRGEIGERPRPGMGRENSAAIMAARFRVVTNMAPVRMTLEIHPGSLARGFPL